MFNKIPKTWKGSKVVSLPNLTEEVKLLNSYRSAFTLSRAVKILESLILLIFHRKLTIFTAFVPSSPPLQHNQYLNFFYQHRNNLKTFSWNNCAGHVRSIQDIWHDLPLHIARTVPDNWTKGLEIYLSGRQPRTQFRGVLPPSRIVTTGVPQDVVL